eukprot:TRINITY_DN14448_c0_g1_i1.p1 TRINITY_DN14448_c0_g1~~TRINITY_DN14448_c0_g1_i1.p1  ORF type:complete len:454 (+),score=123.15 TRINITY_DN14448_c0_g1_i1:57-1418(+)
MLRNTIKTIFNGFVNNNKFGSNGFKPNIDLGKININLGKINNTCLKYNFSNLNRYYNEKVNPGLHQTPIVDQLWKIRQAQNPRVERKQGEPRPTCDSSLDIEYPFSSDPGLVDSYSNPWGKIRIGRVLEDLDALAGNIAAAHCNISASKDDEIVLVTAAVDRIKITHRANLKDDMTLSGKVVWVGSSSMEIRLNCVSSWTTEPWLSAAFVFVGLDPTTLKTTTLPPLLPSTEEEKSINMICEDKNENAKLRRKELMAIKKSKNHLALLDWDSKESIDMARKLVKKAQPLIKMRSLAEPNAVLIKETELENTLICQPQQRNTRGRIFGGFLMRRAYELGFSTAYLFLGVSPVFREVDKVVFKRPVNIGNLLNFRSKVLYKSVSKTTNNPLIHIEVIAKVIDPEGVTSKESNTFHFTFENIHGTKVKNIYPSSVEEAQSVVKQMEINSQQESSDI